MAVLPTNNAPPTPTPPATVNAPVLVDVEVVVLLIKNVLVVLVPIDVTKLPIVAEVMICAPAT